MSDNKLVWSDEEGDVRKKSDKSSSNEGVDESNLKLHLRRLTSGKGRTVIEITNLPNNKTWCKTLAKELKKKLGVGGAYKKDFIEVHGEKMDQVQNHLDSRSIKWIKTGG